MCKSLVICIKLTTPAWHIVLHHPSPLWGGYLIGFRESADNIGPPLTMNGSRRVAEGTGIVCDGLFHNPTETLITTWYKRAAMNLNQHVPM